MRCPLPETPIFRSILAVLGGFAAMAILVMITTAVAAQALIPRGMKASMVPGTPPPKRHLVVNLLCSGLAALLGGSVTARLAGHDAMVHGGALAVLMILMSLVSMQQAAGRQPRWYQLTLVIAMPPIALLGAWIGGA